MTFMRYAPIDAALFVANRKRFADRMESGSVAIIRSNAEQKRTGNTFFSFRQNSNLFYLTGIDQKNVTLVLRPNHVQEELRAVLFIPETDEYSRVWEGENLSKQQVRDISGITNVQWNTSYDEIMSAVSTGAEFSYHDPEYIDSNELSLRNIPKKDITHILGDLRIIKSNQEIQLIQKACNITAAGYNRVLKFIGPGAMEYEIEAEITHEFLRSGASGHAYAPIIASGADACILHYGYNYKECQDGDLVLMDFGAEYANYSSDLTRTIPVNGTFSRRQRDVYEAVLRAFYKAQELLVPGATIATVNQGVGALLEKECVALGLFSESQRDAQDPEKPLYRKYFPHNISHHMGLDVQDVGDRTRPLEPGMVLTIEPGLYIEQEGIGVRIESDFLITDDGNKDLMPEIPTSIAEIEIAMCR